MNFARYAKYIACLLLCAALLSVASPASAITSATIPVDSALIPELPGIAIEDPLDNSAGHQVTVVRLSASYHAADIGSLENGTRITVLESKGDFYKVDCFEMAGYVAKSQVKVTEAGEYYVNCVPGSSETKQLPSISVNSALALRDAIVAEAKKYLGVPYVSGGTSKWGFDCTGFTYRIFGDCGFDLHRSMLKQMAAGVVVAKEDLQCGDLVFFSYTGDHGSFASHIGVYIGNGQIIHASASRGIAIDSLDAPYYTRHYQCSRRVILTDLAPSVSIPTTDIQPGSGWRS